jgi:hypothetical protein
MFEREAGQWGKTAFAIGGYRSMDRAYTFEVIIETAGKVEIEGIYKDESEALQRAEYLLKLAKYTAVRVNRVDSRDNHKPIFEKFYSGQGKVIQLSHVEEVYVCNSLADVYRFDSRLTLLRLLRAYFDEQLMIPSELLHRYVPLRYLERDALLFNQAAHRLSAYQARATNSRADERHSVLMKLFREVLEQAKASDKLAPYAASLAGGGVAGLLEDTDRLAEGDRLRVVTYAFSRHLEELRDWSGKVSAICELFREEQAEPATAVLDEMLAEAIDGNAPVRAVLGYAPDLGSALTSLAATLEGAIDDRYCHTRALQQISDQLAVHALPRTRTALLHRIAVALDGRAPLTKLDRAANIDAFAALVPRLREFGGFQGGSEMSAALVRRAKQVYGKDGEDLPFEDAVQLLIDHLPNPGGRIGFMLDLLPTELGRSKTSFLAQRIAERFANLRSIRDFAPQADSTWSSDMVREDFRRRLYGAGIPRKLADALMRKLSALGDLPDAPPPRPSPPSSSPSLPASSPPAVRLTPPVATPELHQPTATAALLTPPPYALDPPLPGEIRMAVSYRGSNLILGRSHTTAVLGRGEDCDVVVATKTASRAHATIRIEDGKFLLADESKNGTYLVNGALPPMVLNRSTAVLESEGAIYLGTTPENCGSDDSALVRFRLLAPAPAG